MHEWGNTMRDVHSWRKKKKTAKNYKFYAAVEWACEDDVGLQIQGSGFEYILLDYKSNEAVVKVAEKSFRVGTIRLLKNKTSDKIWSEIDAWIGENTNPKYTYRIYGTGGNINKCHKLLGKQLDESISYREIDDLYENLAKLSVTKRMLKYQLKADRADVIVPALQIYKYIMRSMKAKEIVVPKIGLVDGIIYDLYHQEIGF